MTTRIIHRAVARPHQMIADALQSLIIGELLSPGPRILVVSPWMGDVPLLDNRGGQFSTLDANWGARQIRISAILRSLLAQGMSVYVACGPGARQDELVHRLQEAARRDGTISQLDVRRPPHEATAPLEHQKALVTDTWAVHGSMNFTYNGIQLNGELVTVTTDRHHVATVYTELLGLFS